MYEVAVTRADGTEADVRLDDRLKVVTVDGDEESGDEDEAGEAEAAEDKEGSEQDEAGDRQRGSNAP